MPKTTSKKYDFLHRKKSATSESEADPTPPSPRPPLSSISSSSRNVQRSSSQRFPSSATVPLRHSWSVSKAVFVFRHSVPEIPLGDPRGVSRGYSELVRASCVIFFDSIFRSLFKHCFGHRFREFGVPTWAYVGYFFVIFCILKAYFI